MDGNSSYEKFRAAVKSKAANLRKPLEVSQSALWAKSIVVEALDGKHEELFTFRHGDKFGFSELLVNQCIEYALRAERSGTADDESSRAAYLKGYEAARREFAEATGLYTEDDIS